MGLGLTIVHSIVKKHGGLVWIDAPPGQGCLVHLYFPMPKSEDLGKQDAMQKGQNLRVLILDDEELMRLIIKRMFEHFGCEVVLTDSGEEAIRLCQQSGQTGQPFDLALLDLWIDGGTGGLEVIRPIRELQPGLVAVAISGDGGHEVMLRANEHHFTTALAKPFSIEAVEDLILRFF
jgi:CheY-like chemotaxis protein